MVPPFEPSCWPWPSCAIRPWRLARRRSPCPRPWSTGSCRRPGGRDRGHRPGARPRRPGAGGCRAVPPMGDRGPLHRARPAWERRRRRAGRRRRAVRGDEAAPAQRQPLDARLPGLSVRPRASRRSCRRRASRASCARMMADEVAPTPGAAPTSRAYQAQLMSASPTRRSPIGPQQIAMDGSQKLPQRLLDTVREQLAGGGSIAHLALAVAGWMRYASGTDEQGQPIAVADPLAGEFAAIAAAARGNAAEIAAGFLDLAEVFGADLPANAVFRRAVSRDVGVLFRDGVRSTVRGPSRNPVPGRDHGRAAADPAPDRLFPADPASRDLARLCTRRWPSCRSSARMATPIRSGTPTTRRSPTRRRCSSRRITTSSGCSTARAFRWRTSAFRAATARRSSRTRARSGAPSPGTTTCFAARRRGSGSSTRSRRCSAAPSD